MSRPPSLRFWLLGVVWTLLTGSTVSEPISMVGSESGLRPVHMLVVVSTRVNCLSLETATVDV